MDLKKEEGIQAQGQLLVFYSGWSADKCGEKRHPQIVMRDLAREHDFEILAAVPQSIADGWEFWIEWEGWPLYLPEYIGVKAWKPIGEA